MATDPLYEMRMDKKRAAAKYLKLKSLKSGCTHPGS
jgi:hypothetical protein